ncbi:MAG: MarR family transcriptional regulator [Gammaproteobacteria bacterium]|nr:MarR family transcriptional regulator [Gammaproteobacteria bacterium]
MKRLSDSLPMMLYRTLDSVMPNFRRIFAQFGLTEQQWRVLRALWENDSLPLLGLSKATRISSPSLVGVVDRLERDGLVVRERTATDRRIVKVRATAQGLGLEDQVTPLVDQAYAVLNQYLSESDWHNLYKGLDSLIQQHQPHKKEQKE